MERPFGNPETRMLREEEARALAEEARQLSERGDRPVGGGETEVKKPENWLGRIMKRRSRPEQPPTIH